METDPGGVGDDTYPPPELAHLHEHLRETSRHGPLFVIKLQQDDRP